MGRRFEISFTEYVKEISIITFPLHRRRDKKSKITPLELSQLRALNGQLLWFGMQCFATTAGTSVAVDGTHTSSHSGHDLGGEQAGSEGDCMGKDATQNPCPSCSCCGYVHRCWMDHSTRWHFTRWTVSLHCKLRVAARQRIKHVSDIWHSSRLRRVARSSSAAETQAAADGDDEAVYIRLCLKEVLFGQLDLRNWQSEERQIPAAMVVDCRGVVFLS